jgi:hypothetical protein
VTGRVATTGEGVMEAVLKPKSGAIGSPS